MTVHENRPIHNETDANVIRFPAPTIWFDVEAGGFRADRTAIAEPLSVLLKMIPSTHFHTAARALQASGIIWPGRGIDHIVFPIDLANAPNWHLQGGRDV